MIHEAGLDEADEHDGGGGTVDEGAEEGSRPRPESLRVVMTERMLPEALAGGFAQAVGHDVHAVDEQGEAAEDGEHEEEQGLEADGAEIGADKPGGPSTICCPALERTELHELFDAGRVGLGAGVEPDGLDIGIEAVMDGDFVGGDAVDGDIMDAGARGSPCRCGRWRQSSRRRRRRAA